MGSDRELVTTRLLDAPPERVFRAFSEAEHLAQWWGPNGFTNTFHEFDLRTGATWRYTMHGPNRADYPNESAFVEVLRGQRIVIDHVSGPRFQLTITLASEAGKIRALAVPANEQNLDRLQARLAMMA